MKVFTMSNNNSAAITAMLKPVQHLLDDPDVNDVCINQPGVVFARTKLGFVRHDIPTMDFDKCSYLASAIAAYSDKLLDEKTPILSTRLPDGNRVEILRPPATESNTISVTIRKPSTARFTLDQYDEWGYFKHIDELREYDTQLQTELLELVEKKEYVTFLKRAVTNRLNIVVAGTNGLGKTTFVKALVDLIPAHERIVTIENAHELDLPHHSNHVHLMYVDKGERKDAVGVDASTLLKSTLRMTSDRVIMGELRGGETFDFINLALSGLNGSITTLHAGSVDSCLVRLRDMAIMSEEGRSLPYEVLKSDLFQAVDVIVNLVWNDSLEGLDKRCVQSIWYDPSKKEKLS